MWSAPVFVLFVVQTVLAEDYVTVKTEIGNIKGYRVKSIEGKDVNVFIGVPFAKPPIGDLRFKRPLPLEPSDREFDALEKKPMCPQIPMKLPDLILENVFYGEDCLYMNIFASAEVTENLKPVMIYLYGGFFQWGDINLGLYDGVEFAAEVGAVLALPAYRVNIFGFMNSTTEAAPGNAGLFDQLMAMKFVKKNVEAFGGDPNLITLAGQSAGAISTSVHTSSPASKGLFRRAMMLSGTASSLAFFSESNVQTLLFTMSNFLDCFDGNFSIAEQYNQMAQCLKTLDMETLVSQMKKLDGNDLLGCGPGFDGEIIAGDVKRPSELQYNVEVSSV